MAGNFNTRVAIQEAVLEQNEAGEFLAESYQDLDGHESIPAVLMPSVDERYQERYDDDQNLWQIVLAGHWPLIKTQHFVLHDDVRYEVKRVTLTKAKRVTTMLARLGRI